jgi:hypothetical protein
MAEIIYPMYLSYGVLTPGVLIVLNKLPLYPIRVPTGNSNNILLSRRVTRRHQQEYVEDIHEHTQYLSAVKNWVKFGLTGV